MIPRSNRDAWKYLWKLNSLFTFFLVPISPESVVSTKSNQCRNHEDQDQGKCSQLFIKGTQQKNCYNDSEVITFMLLASPHEGETFKFLYLSVTHLFSSERKYIPVNRAVIQELQGLSSRHRHRLTWSKLNHHMGGIHHMAVEGLIWSSRWQTRQMWHSSVSGLLQTNRSNVLWSVVKWKASCRQAERKHLSTVGACKKLTALLYIG